MTSLPDPTPAVTPGADLSGKHIVLGLSGGIACYKAAELARALVKAGATVQVVMTEAAEHFITPVTMQALSGRPVYTSTWDTRDVDGNANNMAHINLTRQADAVLVAPASADFMAKLLHGRADDLLSLLCLARPIERCPLLIAPAMNREMWSHPATQRNVAQLRADGTHLLGPDSGAQACGGKCGLDPVHHIAPGSGSEPIPQHHIRARVAGAGVGLDRLMRHGMAIDQNCLAELRKAFIQKGFQRRVIGVPIAQDAQLRLGPGQFAAIDCAPTCDDAGDHPQPGRNARVVRCPVNPFDHRGVKLIRRAVQVDIGARHAGSDQRCAVHGCRGKELIDKGIFGRPDRVAIQKAL